jgi:tRNA A37 threonylcarbamoyladenosine biosynthesis protein TsaE
LQLHTAAGDALDVAQHDETVVHASAWALLKDTATGVAVDKQSIYAKWLRKNGGSATAATTADSMLLHYVISAVDANFPVVTDMKRMLMQFNGAERMQAMSALLSGYMPPLVLTSISTSKDHLMGEMRQCTILFINLPFAYNSSEALRGNQKAFRLVQGILDRYDGSLRQLIQDDKGTVAILAFGLPQLSHEDDPLRGIMTALMVRKTLLRKCNVVVSIGVATGNVFCGSVGNEWRCEYAIVGQCVNLSARMMCLPATGDDDGGVFCDVTTYDAIVNGRRTGNESIVFGEPLWPKIKGYTEPVAVYQPSLNVQDESLGASDIPVGGATQRTSVLSCVVHFLSCSFIAHATSAHSRSFRHLFLSRLQLVGREDELARLTGRIADLREEQKGSVVFILAEAGMGKTRLLQEATKQFNDQREGDELVFTDSDESDDDDCELILLDPDAKPVLFSPSEGDATATAAAAAAATAVTTLDKGGESAATAVAVEGDVGGDAAASTLSPQTKPPSLLRIATSAPPVDVMQEHENTAPKTRVRVMYSSGKTVSSSTSYVLWRSLVPALLTESAAELGRRQQLAQSSGDELDGLLGLHDSGDAPMPLPIASQSAASANASRQDQQSRPIAGDSRASSLVDWHNLLDNGGGSGGGDGGGGDATPVISVKVDAPLATDGNNNVDAAAPMPAMTNRTTKREERERKIAAHRRALTVCGVPEKEHSLLNTFAPKGLVVAESTYVQGLSRFQRGLRVGQIVSHLLSINIALFGPVLLILENVHLLDAFSWIVLFHICKDEGGSAGGKGQVSLFDRGLMMIMTSRPPGLTLQAKYSLLQNMPRITTVLLEPLKQRYIERLCAQQLKLDVEELPPALTSFITKASRGNPLFVQELLLSVQESKLPASKSQAAETSSLAMAEPISPSSRRSQGGGETSDSESEAPLLVFNGDDGDAQNYTIPALSKSQILADALRFMVDNVVTKKRRFRMKVYPNCFLGNEAFSLLLHFVQERGMSRTAEYRGTEDDIALRLGNQLLTLAVFEHVTKDHVFKNMPLFYTFADREHIDRVHGQILEQAAEQALRVQNTQGRRSNFQRAGAPVSPRSSTSTRLSRVNNGNLLASGRGSGSGGGGGGGGAKEDVTLPTGRWSMPMPGQLSASIASHPTITVDDSALVVRHSVPVNGNVGGADNVLSSLVSISSRNRKFNASPVSAGSAGSVKSKNFYQTAGLETFLHLADVFSVSSVLQQIMASRIDRLSGQEQDALKIAAVIGVDFTKSLFVRILSKSRQKSDIENDLSSLLSLGFLISTGTASEDAFEFRHLTMRDVAYKMLSAADLRRSHLRVATCIEEEQRAKSSDGGGGGDGDIDLIVSSNNASLGDGQTTLTEVLIRCSTVALHFCTAGRAFRAIFYYERAVYAALKLCEYVMAVEYLTAIRQLAQPSLSLCSNLSLAKWSRQLAEASCMICDFNVAYDHCCEALTQLDEKLLPTDSTVLNQGVFDLGAVFLKRKGDALVQLDEQQYTFYDYHCFSPTNHVPETVAVLRCIVDIAIAQENIRLANYTALTAVNVALRSDSFLLIATSFVAALRACAVDAERNSLKLSTAHIANPNRVRPRHPHRLVRYFYAKGVELIAQFDEAHKKAAAEAQRRGAGGLADAAAMYNMANWGHSTDGDSDDGFSPNFNGGGGVRNSGLAGLSRGGGGTSPAQGGGNNSADGDDGGDDGDNVDDDDAFNGKGRDEVAPPVEPEVVGFLLYELAMVDIAVGNWPVARAHLQRALNINSWWGDLVQRQRLLTSVALVHLLRGDFEASNETMLHAKEQLSLPEEVPALSILSDEIVVGVAENMLAKGDVKEAVVELRSLRMRQLFANVDVGGNNNLFVDANLDDPMATAPTAPGSPAHPLSPMSEQGTHAHSPRSLIDSPGSVRRAIRQSRSHATRLPQTPAQRGTGEAVDEQQEEAPDLKIWCRANALMACLTWHVGNVDEALVFAEEAFLGMSATTMVQLKWLNPICNLATVYILSYVQIVLLERRAMDGAPILFNDAEATGGGGGGGGGEVGGDEDALVLQGFHTYSLQVLDMLRRLSIALPACRPRFLLWQGVFRLGQALALNATYDRSLWMSSFTLAQSLELALDAGLAAMWLNAFDEATLTTLGVPVVKHDGADLMHRIKRVVTCGGCKRAGDDGMHSATQRRDVPADEAHAAGVAMRRGGAWNLWTEKFLIELFRHAALDYQVPAYMSNVIAAKGDACSGLQPRFVIQRECEVLTSREQLVREQEQLEKNIDARNRAAAADDGNGDDANAVVPFDSATHRASKEFVSLSLTQKRHSGGNGDADHANKSRMMPGAVTNMSSALPVLRSRLRRMSIDLVANEKLMPAAMLAGGGNASRRLSVTPKAGGAFSAPSASSALLRVRGDEGFLKRLCHRVRAQFAFVTHRTRHGTFKRAFTVRLMVDWLIQQSLAASRAFAVDFVQFMHLFGFIERLEDDVCGVVADDDANYNMLISEDFDEVRFNTSALKQIAVDLSTDRGRLPVKRRTHRMRGYQNCFTGRDAVDLLLVRRIVSSEAHAVRVMQLLMQESLIERINGIDIAHVKTFFSFVVQPPGIFANPLATGGKRVGVAKFNFMLPDNASSLRDVAKLESEMRDAVLSPVLRNDHLSRTDAHSSVGDRHHLLDSKRMSRDTRRATRSKRKMLISKSSDAQSLYEKERQHHPLRLDQRASASPQLGVRSALASRETSSYENSDGVLTPSLELASRLAPHSNTKQRSKSTSGLHSNDGGMTLSLPMGPPSMESRDSEALVLAEAGDLFQVTQFSSDMSSDDGSILSDDGAEIDVRPEFDASRHGSRSHMRSRSVMRNSFLVPTASPEGLSAGNSRFMGGSLVGSPLFGHSRSPSINNVHGGLMPGGFRPANLGGSSGFDLDLTRNMLTGKMKDYLSMATALAEVAVGVGGADRVLGNVDTKKVRKCYGAWWALLKSHAARAPIITRYRSQRARMVAAKVTDLDRVPTLMQPLPSRRQLNCVPTQVVLELLCVDNTDLHLNAVTRRSFFAVIIAVELRLGKPGPDILFEDTVAAAVDGDAAEKPNMLSGREFDLAFETMNNIVDFYCGRLIGVRGDVAIFLWEHVDVGGSGAVDAHSGLCNHVRDCAVALARTHDQPAFHSKVSMNCGVVRAFNAPRAELGGGRMVSYVGTAIEEAVAGIVEGASMIKKLVHDQENEIVYSVALGVLFNIHQRQTDTGERHSILVAQRSMLNLQDDDAPGRMQRSSTLPDAHKSREEKITRSNSVIDVDGAPSHMSSVGSNSSSSSSSSSNDGLTSSRGSPTNRRRDSQNSSMVSSPEAKRDSLSADVDDAAPLVPTATKLEAATAFDLGATADADLKNTLFPWTMFSPSVLTARHAALGVNTAPLTKALTAAAVTRKNANDNNLDSLALQSASSNEWRFLTTLSNSVVLQSLTEYSAGVITLKEKIAMYLSNRYGFEFSKGDGFAKKRGSVLTTRLSENGPPLSRQGTSDRDLPFSFTRQMSLESNAFNPQLALMGVACSFTFGDERDSNGSTAGEARRRARSSASSGGSGRSSHKSSGSRSPASRESDPSLRGLARASDTSVPSIRTSNVGEVGASVRSSTTTSDFMDSAFHVRVSEADNAFEPRDFDDSLIAPDVDKNADVDVSGVIDDAAAADVDVDEGDRVSFRTCVVCHLSIPKKAKTPVDLLDGRFELLLAGVHYLQTLYSVDITLQTAGVAFEAVAVLESPLEAARLAVSMTSYFPTCFVQCVVGVGSGGCVPIAGNAPHRDILGLRYRGEAVQAARACVAHCLSILAPKDMKRASLASQARTRSVERSDHMASHTSRSFVSRHDFENEAPVESHVFLCNETRRLLAADTTVEVVERTVVKKRLRSSTSNAAYTSTRNKSMKSPHVGARGSDYLSRNTSRQMSVTSQTPFVSPRRQSASQFGDGVDVLRTDVSYRLLSFGSASGGFQPVLRGFQPLVGKHEVLADLCAAVAAPFDVVENALLTDTQAQRGRKNYQSRHNRRVSTSVRSRAAASGMRSQDANRADDSRARGASIEANIDAGLLNSLVDSHVVSKGVGGKSVKDECGNVIVLLGAAGTGKSLLLQHFGRIVRATMPLTSSTFVSCSESNLTNQWSTIGHILMRLINLPKCRQANNDKMQSSPVKGERLVALEDALMSLFGLSFPYLVDYLFVLNEVLPVHFRASELLINKTMSEREEATCRLVLALVSTITLNSSFVVCIDNAHWMDASSAACLARLVATFPNSCVVVTTRSIVHAPLTSMQMPGASKQTSKRETMAAPSGGINELKPGPMPMLGGLGGLGGSMRNLNRNDSFQDMPPHPLGKGRGGNPIAFLQRCKQHNVAYKTVELALLSDVDTVAMIREHLGVMHPSEAFVRAVFLASHGKPSVYVDLFSKLSNGGKVIDPETAESFRLHKMPPVGFGGAVLLPIDPDAKSDERDGDDANGVRSSPSYDARPTDQLHLSDNRSARDSVIINNRGNGDVFDSRFDALSVAARSTLQWASVLGEDSFRRTFLADVIAETGMPIVDVDNNTGRPNARSDPRVLEAVAAVGGTVDLGVLVTAGFLSWTGTDDDELSFNVSRATIYDNIRPPLRRSLHMYVAEYLEKQNKDSDHNARLLAHHWNLADRLTKALEYTILEANMLLSSRVLAHSAVIFSQALELCAKIAQRPPERRRWKSRGHGNLSGMSMKGGLGKRREAQLRDEFGDWTKDDPLTLGTNFVVQADTAGAVEAIGVSVVAFAEVLPAIMEAARRGSADENACDPLERRKRRQNGMLVQEDTAKSGVGARNDTDYGTSATETEMSQTMMSVDDWNSRRSSAATTTPYNIAAPSLMLSAPVQTEHRSSLPNSLAPPPMQASIRRSTAGDETMNAMKAGLMESLKRPSVTDVHRGSLPGMHSNASDAAHDCQLALKLLQQKTQSTPRVARNAVAPAPPPGLMPRGSFNGPSATPKAPPPRMIVVTSRAHPAVAARSQFFLTEATLVDLLASFAVVSEEMGLHVLTTRLLSLLLFVSGQTVPSHLPQVSSRAARFGLTIPTAKAQFNAQKQQEADSLLHMDTFMRTTTTGTFNGGNTSNSSTSDSLSSFFSNIKRKRRAKKKTARPPTPMLRRPQQLTREGSRLLSAVRGSTRRLMHAVGANVDTAEQEERRKRLGVVSRTLTNSTLLIALERLAWLWLHDGDTRGVGLRCCVRLVHMVLRVKEFKIMPRALSLLALCARNAGHATHADEFMSIALSLVNYDKAGAGERRFDSTFLPFNSHATVRLHECFEFMNRGDLRLCSLVTARLVNERCSLTGDSHIERRVLYSHTVLLFLQGNYRDCLDDVEAVQSLMDYQHDMTLEAWCMCLKCFLWILCDTWIHFNADTGEEIEVTEEHINDTLHMASTMSFDVDLFVFARVLLSLNHLRSGDLDEGGMGGMGVGGLGSGGAASAFDNDAPLQQPPSVARGGSEDDDNNVILMNGVRDSRAGTGDSVGSTGSPARGGNNGARGRQRTSVSHGQRASVSHGHGVHASAGGGGGGGAFRADVLDRKHLDARWQAEVRRLCYGFGFVAQAFPMYEAKPVSTVEWTSILVHIAMAEYHTELLSHLCRNALDTPMSDDAVNTIRQALANLDVIVGKLAAFAAAFAFADPIHLLYRGVQSVLNSRVAAAFADWHAALRAVRRDGTHGMVDVAAQLHYLLGVYSSSQDQARHEQLMAARVLFNKTGNYLLSKLTRTALFHVSLFQLHASLRQRLLGGVDDGGELDDDKTESEVGVRSVSNYDSDAGCDAAGGGGSRRLGPRRSSAGSVASLDFAAASKPSTAPVERICTAHSARLREFLEHFSVATGE